LFFKIYFLPKKIKLNDEIRRKQINNQRKKNKQGQACKLGNGSSRLGIKKKKAHASGLFSPIFFLRGHVVYLF
jgi:hypothetical protein